MSDAEDGLLAIALSDSDDQPGETDANPKDSRTGQSVQAFEAVKKSYKAKVEGGEIWKDVSLPLKNPEKLEVQAVLHAVEELYFFRRLDEALVFLAEVLRGAEGLADGDRGLLEAYQLRCRKKLDSGTRNGK